MIDRRSWLKGAATLGLAPSALTAGCATTSEANASIDIDRSALAQVIARHEVATAGIGLMRDGRLVWESYLGEQSPGVAPGPQTRFNVASITKTVTTETILRLADQGRLSLDEPMSPWWVDPHLADDPRHHRLTPRLALTHSTGLPNWRFFLPGGRLAFQHDPGQGYSYSGEGMEYVARFAERRLGRSFPDLVRETVLSPLSMADTRFVVDRSDLSAFAQPVDAAGVAHGVWCRPPNEGGCRPDGAWSAADEMTTTVADYARFLSAVLDGRGYGAGMVADRDRIQTGLGAERVVDCAASPDLTCPVNQGYGLGFLVLDYGDVRVLGHGGADWTEVGVAYGRKPHRSGVIVFLNAPNARALAAMPDILDIVDPRSPFAPQYRRWAARAKA